MRILFDGRALDGSSSGVRDIARGLVDGLRILENKGEVELLVASPIAQGAPSTLRIATSGFMEFGLSLAALARRADRILIPRQTVPLIPVAAVPVFHDIGFLQHPELYPAASRISLTTRMAAKSRHGLAVSTYTAAEMAAAGLGRSITPLPIAAIHQLRWEPDTDQRYLLCVAAQEPHKNLLRLIDGWGLADTAEVQLVICGRPGKDSSRIGEFIARSSKRSTIDVRSDLSDAAYTGLLEHCWGYVQPSLYEGLCVPALDLAAAGTPTVLSRDSNLGAVFAMAPDNQLFDPLSTSSIAASLTRLIEDDPFRLASSEFNKATVRITNWQNVAELAVQGMR